MANLGEALRKALEENPDSKLAPAIKSVNQAQAKELKVEKHRKELERLGGRFEYLGRSWYHLGTGFTRSYPSKELNSIVEIRKEWQNLQARFIYLQKSDRLQMLAKLAIGMDLSEGHTADFYRKLAFNEMLNNPLQVVQEIFRDVRFSPASIAFLGALSDISEHNDAKKASFNDFMGKRKDLRGLVKLPQIFPAVADWFVQQQPTPSELGRRLR